MGQDQEAAAAGELSLKDVDRPIGDFPDRLGTLNPATFRNPKGQRPTRYLYIARCGRGCGETPESVLAAFATASPDNPADGLHVGQAGISYARFATPEAAEQVRAGLAQTTRWVVRFAEQAADECPISPSSVASTADVQVPGMEVFTDFVTEAEAEALLQAVDSLPWDESIKRRVQHYGHAFDYARLALEDGGRPQLPEFCRDVARRISERSPHPVDQLTVNEYQPGVGIASHCDAHSAFEDGIVALTLGAGLVMEFRRPRPDAGGKVSVGRHHRLAPPPPEESRSIEHKNVWLPANSLLILRGEARYAWQHGIAWRKTDCLAPGQVVPRTRRVSLTFRTARFKPCDCTWPMMCDAQNPEAHMLPSRLNAAAATEVAPESPLAQQPPGH